MLKEIAEFVNIVDLVVLAVFVRTVYIGSAKGFSTEFFKLLGLLLALFVTLHYYNQFVPMLQQFAAMPVNVTELMAFVLLWLFIVVLFKIVREGWMLLINPEGKTSMFQKVGGVILALPRAVLLCSLTFILIFVSGNETLATKAHKSWTGFYFMDLAPQMYSAAHDLLISKVFPAEGINKEVFKLKNRYKAKSQ